MKLFIKKKLHLFALILGMSQIAVAQSPTPRYEVGAQVSTFIYHGDLTTYKFGSRKTAAYGFGVFGALRFNESLSLRANIARGKLKGDDKRYPNPIYTRGFNFDTPITEVSGLLVWDVLGRGAIDIPPNIFPYVMGGIGYSFLDIRRDYSQNEYGPTHPYTIGLEKDIAETPPSRIPVAMAGLGVRRYLTEKLAVNAEFMYRFTSTDYLDGFSESGDPSKNDSYYTFSAGLSYSFGERNGRRGGGSFKKGKGRKGKIDCPVYE
ncbi:DUF6089 family protein [Pontibacter sp. MBLB2868]|uniref:DUF6089 family protein n=1 Tax=Pontibacter sp. MBLB2868 TaxID=3451555 RepID=UPI003F74DF56